MPETEHDALDALRARLEETRAHAQRLADGARAGAAGGEPAGGEPGPEEERAAPPPGDAAADLQAIAALLATLRELVPEELQQQLAEVTRQVLLLLRALIDWWVDRLEEPARPGPREGGPPAGQDIPVR